MYNFLTLDQIKNAESPIYCKFNTVYDIVDAKYPIVAINIYHPVFKPSDALTSIIIRPKQVSDVKAYDILRKLMIKKHIRLVKGQVTFGLFQKDIKCTFIDYTCKNEDSIFDIDSIDRLQIQNFPYLFKLNLIKKTKQDVFRQHLRQSTNTIVKILEFITNKNERELTLDHKSRVQGFVRNSLISISMMTRYFRAKPYLNTFERGHISCQLNEQEHKTADRILETSKSRKENISFSCMNSNGLLVSVPDFSIIRYVGLFKVREEILLQYLKHIGKLHEFFNRCEMKLLEFV